jgi:hypothetical protein
VTCNGGATRWWATPLSLPGPSLSGPRRKGDFEVAEATYRAAVARWPAALITLRQGARVLERNWSTSEAAN